ncbi:uncharacterized protein LOC125068496 isoform X2 [Vanessa atalanta]|uniref:uncharacterized protein LOC125068496 isoform X2 n=1 Tax=Vanessa atalanta TaxID=42275 RepID=UPI001FCE0BCD|nr:uncharacterized protein LOC125068496 isoform X2 [Vanessa atalanta]
MNDPWDVKSVRQSNQYMSCMKINGVPLLPPVLSKECRTEMKYYKLLAKEVEKRIQSLKPFFVGTDTDSAEDKTDAPELPESEQSFELPLEAIQADKSENNDKLIYQDNEKCLDESSGKLCLTSNTCDNITSNLTLDESASSKLSSKLVIDLSLSINDTGKSVLDSVNKAQKAPDDLPERDCDCPKKDQTELVSNNEKTNDEINDKLSFHVSISNDTVSDPITLQFSQDGPASLSSKSFTGSLNDIHTESIKESPLPLTRQRSYTVLKPSPMLLAHLEVQSINTGMDVTSISMSESLSNLSCSNKKRRSWDLETAKVKWSSMALELKEKNINNAKINVKHTAIRPTARKPQSTHPKSKSLVQDKPKRNSSKVVPKSEPIQKPKKAVSPVRNPIPHNNANVKTPTNHLGSQKTEVKKKPISETEDPATRVRELYEKIQKQQLIQMANLVEKQKKEQMLLQQVFEEQNNLLFTQLKTICPKSPNEVKEAWVDKTHEVADRGPVSLSQLINNKPEQNTCDSPVLSTLTETNDYIHYCDNVLKKSRDITGSMKKQQTMKDREKNKTPSPKPQKEGSKTRTHSPVRKSTPTSRKLTYETSVSSDRDYDPILTDRTNDTMADLNVTFPSDRSEESQVYANVNVNNPAAIESPISRPISSCRSTDKAIRSMEETIQNSINSMCGRTARPKMYRAPTAKERSAATKIVAHAKGYLVRRLMKSERVQATVQTIKDALMCALQLHQDREGIRGADVDLHRRLIQQITAACYSLHDTFVASTAAERCAMIAADRSRRRSLAARVSPALSHRQYRPTDI